MWYCGHCGSGPYHQELDDYCHNCHRRQDGYAHDVPITLPVKGKGRVRSQHAFGDVSRQVVQVDTNERSRTEQKLSSARRADPSSQDDHSSKHQDQGVEILVRDIKPHNELCNITQDYLSPLDKPASQTWVPHSRTKFPGQSCFSLETGEAATAPRKQPYSPGRRAEVAYVRSNGGACLSCKKHKKACCHKLEDYRSGHTTEADGLISERPSNARLGTLETMQERTDQTITSDTALKDALSPLEKTPPRGRIALRNLKWPRHTPYTNDAKGLDSAANTPPSDGMPNTHPLHPNPQKDYGPILSTNRSKPLNSTVTNPLPTSIKSTASSRPDYIRVNRSLTHAHPTSTSTQPHPHPPFPPLYAPALNAKTSLQNPHI
ncbi:hypothetical protein MMC13_002020 [Lambiella insularis]|nr:hypothetical protein [Lambiella insularis]